MSDSGKIHPTQRIDTQATERKPNVQADEAIEKDIEQVSSDMAIDELLDVATSSPARRDFRPLEEIKVKKKETQQTARKEEVEEAVERIENIDETAERYQRQNLELQKRTLLILKSQIKASDSVDEILAKIEKFYPDKFLADEVLDFFIETSSFEFKQKFLEAKAVLHSRFDREITVGKNITTQARAFSEQGLGSPTALRDLYRDITMNPRTPETLLNELFQKYPYALLKPTISFLLHSLGADLKSKGSSMPKAELKQKLDETRTLQALLGVYRFFKSRMKLLRDQFANRQLSYPEMITFETLAKQFLSLLSERYLTASRILQLLSNLHFSEEEIAEILILMQFRDAVRNVAPRLYKTKQQKDDLLEAILEALEELESEEEEKEE